MLSFSIWAHGEGKKREGSFLEGDKLSAQGSPWRWCPAGTKTLWSGAQERNQRAGAVRTQARESWRWERCVSLGRREPEGKTQDRALGGGSGEGGVGRRSENEKGQ